MVAKRTRMYLVVLLPWGGGLAVLLGVKSGTVFVSPCSLYLYTFSFVPGNSPFAFITMLFSTEHLFCILYGVCRFITQVERTWRRASLSVLLLEFDFRRGDSIFSQMRDVPSLFTSTTFFDITFRALLCRFLFIWIEVTHVKMHPLE